MMKKNFLLSALIISFLFFSCNRKSENNEYPSGKMPTEVKTFANIHGLSNLSCIILDDYDFNEMVNFVMTRGQVNAAACSEVRKGNFVARNLDWFQYDQATYLVAIGHTDEHLASLTVCSLNDVFTHDFDCTNLSATDANHFVGSSTDGINEKGVYIGVNVVPFGQMVTGEGDGKIDYRPESGENKDKAQLYTSLLVRLVLDHATDLKDAERIIKETPWLDFPMLNNAGFQCHWLVATEEGSFVCEFIDGKPTFTYAASPNSADYGNIMTNFSNYLMANGGTIQSHGSGFERFDALASNYDSTAIIDLARLVFYSRMYSEDYTAPGYFWTEWASDKYPAQQLMTWRDDSTTRTGELWDKFVNSYNDDKAKYDWRVVGYDTDRTRGSWYTSHSSIWDLAKKTLVIDIEEQDKFAVKFNLDGTFESTME